MGFVHLHNHSEYSLLDGANRIPDMVKRCEELGMDALAITDHGVMFGVMEFYMECQKRGVKPIIGMEAYVDPKGMHSRGERDDYHLLLLAKDIEGYRNLCKLATYAALEGYYYRPRIDHDLLRKHAAGLMGTSTCLGSEICQALVHGDKAKANYLAGMYKEIFGPENYFIELQDHRIADQALIRQDLIDIARKLDLPIIATNDAHYLCKTDASPHDVLLCIQTGSLQNDAKRFRFEGEEFYLKSEEEMAGLFADVPEAIDNTRMVADFCNLELGKQRASMPDPELPSGMTPTSYLRQLAEEGLSRTREGEQALPRLEYELSVIEKTGFESYFLLVREFANYAREKNIYYGVRGSAAGSLVSYCIGITDVDPMEYDLTFERFLNPERVSMPDVDMDFEDARRDEIIQYVTEKYGQDHVAQIVTFGTLGAKAAIKDCGRVLGYTPQETDRICKTIPNLPGMSIERAMQESAEFRQMVQNEPKTLELVNTAKRVEGIARHCGVHAAGVVIAKDPLVNHIPLYRGNEGQAITAFEMGILEKIGLLKMDFLGLSNLTVVARAIENIRSTLQAKGLSESQMEQDHPVVQNILAIPHDDPAAWAMLGRGETVGVFQLESGGMTRYVAQLKPQNIRELAAMVALYRPGPMEHIPRFIDTKFGRAEATYLEPRMETILGETFGVIVYQDQVLKLVQALAGFSLGKADILRRAMGKKDKDAMDSMKIEFMEGCAQNEVSKSAAEKVWELLLPFAGYAFNKAHAVCYAILAYQTAYLKANYPVEYMAALMTVYREKEERVVAFCEECRRLRIAVLPPDVNASGIDFSVEGTAVRFGLAAIKGVGEGLCRGLIKDRAEDGPYQHLYEFSERMKLHGLGRIALEAFVKSGALDSVDANRATLLRYCDAALTHADQANRDRLKGQDSLFGESNGDTPTLNYPPLPPEPALGKSERLALEKETLGIYVSDHPLRGYERHLAKASSVPCSQIEEQEDSTKVKLAGVIAGLRVIVTKRTGEKMASVILEDFSGQASLIAFAATYAKFREVLVKDTVVKISGAIMHRERPGSGGEKSVEVRIESVEPMEPSLDLPAPLAEMSRGTVVIHLQQGTRTELEAIRGVLAKYPGDHEVLIQILPEDEAPPIQTLLCIAPNSAFKQALSSVMPTAKLKIYGMLDEEAEAMVAGA